MSFARPCAECGVPFMIYDDNSSERYCSNHRTDIPATVSELGQKLEEVIIHHVNVITDSDWFAEQLDLAVERYMLANPQRCERCQNYRGEEDHD